MNNKVNIQKKNKKVLIKYLFVPYVFLKSMKSMVLKGKRNVYMKELNVYIQLSHVTIKKLNIIKEKLNITIKKLNVIKKLLNVTIKKLNVIKEVLNVTIKKLNV